MIDTFLFEVVQPKVSNEQTALLLFLVIVELEDGTTQVNSF
jgi:hypothetical protein